MSGRLTYCVCRLTALKLRYIWCETFQVLMSAFVRVSVHKCIVFLQYLVAAGVVAGLHWHSITRLPAHVYRLKNITVFSSTHTYIYYTVTHYHPPPKISLSLSLPPSHLHLHWQYSLPSTGQWPPHLPPVLYDRPSSLPPRGRRSTCWSPLAQRCSEHTGSFSR